MKVLWITNILFPEVVTSLLQKSTEIKSSGGWMLGAVEALHDIDNISLVIATVSPMVKVLTKIIGEHDIYYVIPLGKGNLRENDEYGKYWKQIYDDIKPDIVHIHGTEFSHGYEYMKSCGCNNVVISLQGLKTAISYYYNYGISKFDILRNLTIRDIFKGSILIDKKRFARSAEYEIKMLKLCRYIIGRTQWDQARAWAINPSAKYYTCNETLRKDFYSGEVWTYDNCQMCSIFVSQASYPIKGFHQLLKAMPLILRHYPDTVIRVAGYDITKCNSLRDFLHLSGYGRYIRKLIKQYNLNDKIEFLGELNASSMKEEYLKANVFVCPSSIENSPNSLGEAQILGVPCVASYVGGVPDMMAGNEVNLFRFEEIELLAKKICDVFSNKISPVINNIAAERHNPKNNTMCLVNIYSSIIDSVNEI